MKKLPILAVPFLLTPLLTPAISPAQSRGSLQLVQSVPLPHITGGDFDHFAVDEKGNRLYVVSEVYASIEVFDLKSGSHLQSLTGKVKSPRKIVFLADKHALFVADGGAACVRVFDTNDFHELAQIPLEAGPDAGVYDEATRTFYVGNGGKAAKQSSSFVSSISVDTYAVTGRIEVPASTLKTIALDPKARKLYVTMRDKNQVAVIDLESNSLEKLWTDQALHADSAMALDARNHRAFIGDRNPGLLVVMDMENGSSVASLPIGDTSDDMVWDGRHHRLFVSSADGVDVIAQDGSNKYRLVQHVDTYGGKTSIYVPALHRFYVVHTKSDKAAEAGLQIFDVK